MSAMMGEYASMVERALMKVTMKVVARELLLHRAPVQMVTLGHIVKTR